ncbi:flavodoxin domain-containing protein [Clostridium sp. DJ247]|uniref:flavodoxin domain-containing protein n=1 Tax=Clostridium sp. DJ247 TaxID=2726188 RepID=UPI0016257874|nr:flavodoxin domain-containing protein [Clostridium sp. DJ247]MBC2582153.1 flavodoxin [Clostridium sp. DJ247]
MNTLIIYATKHGTTEKCASILSKKLTGKIDLHNLKVGESPDLTKYHRVIIGGSIYVGKIQKEVSTFCLQNLNELKNKKLGLFICCMFKNDAEVQLNNSFHQELLDSAAAKENFGGEMRFSDMSFIEKTITKIVSKTVAKNDTSLSAMDVKKDMCMILEKNIDGFAQQMNNV